MKIVALSLASVALLLAGCGGKTVDGIADPPPGGPGADRPGSPVGGGTSPGASKVDATTACMHLVQVCSIYTADCRDANDQYARLTVDQKADADEQIACIMSADDCDDIGDCIEEDGPPQIPPTDAESACLQMRSVCSELRNLDCSRVNEQYAKLSSSQRIEADRQIACIMSAVDCEEISMCSRP